MCTKSRPIYNRYIKKLIQVDCGKCPACQQKKAAARASRIRNNISPAYTTLFVTLTYDNKFVPYVFRKDLEEQKEVVPVYRDYKFRYTRVDSSYDFQALSTYSPEIQAEVLMSYDSGSCDNLHDLKKRKGKIGVCYYPDVQKFFKRFRQILLRDYNCNDTFLYFSCSEYGGSTIRPHFHLLLFVPCSQESTFRSAVIKAWPYADRRRTAEYIEVARDAASYVSSYVNCSSYVSKVLQDNFKSKHSYSKSFGMGLDVFSLASLLQKIGEGDLSFNVKRVKDGVSDVVSVPIPKYVINRRFPLFKGYSRIIDAKVREYILCPERLFEVKDEFDYTPKEILAVKISLDNAFKRYNFETGRNRFDYAIDFSNAWRCYKSTCVRHLHSRVEDLLEYKQFYDNNNELNFGLVHSPNLEESFNGLDGFVEDPNTFKFRVLEDFTMSDLFFKCCKQKVVTNECMTLMGHDV